MAISINPVSPVAAAQQAGGVAPELVLQPGSVVNAQVLQVLSADLVRIAIANLSIDVGTQIPLQQGQALQLAVSHTADGIRLALVGQGGDARRRLGDAVTLSPDAQVDVANRPTIVAPKSVLTPVERAAVTAAAQTAATEQDSLAPLFANLGAAASSGNLPPKLQQAIAQVLAQQTSLDQNLDGGDIKTAFQKSGILLEASLASGSVPPTGAPDLKAALIVLRQTLQTALGTNAAVTAPTASGTAQAATQNAAAARGPCAVRQPELDAEEIMLPQARLAVAQDLVQAAVAGRSALAAALHAGPTAGATLNLLQEALQELGNPARAAATLKDMARRRRHRSHQYAAAAVSRLGADAAADRVALDRAGCAALDHRASSARQHRCRDRAANPAAGRLAAGPRRHVRDRASTRRRRAGISKFRS